jgi:peptidoglycan/LPS O-acetylase OafA/YrhL
MLPQKAGNLLWDMLEPFVAFSCGLTAIGFGKQYLTKNNRLRKLANEAIYPFYLLHQPVIVVVGYYMVKWDISILWKVVFITIASFAITIAIYWFLIRPFNFIRVIFGMKWQQKYSREAVIKGQLNPIPVLIEKSNS